MLAEDGLKADHIDRLADNGDHSCVIAVLDFSVRLKRGHADDFELWVRIHLQDGPRGLQAVHSGHVLIHEDQLVLAWVGADHVDGLLAARRLIGLFLHQVAQKGLQRNQIKL